MSDLVFIEESHEYFLDGKRLPSVTEVIGMLSDFSFVPADIMERASAFGSAVHKAVELYELDDLDESALSTGLVPYLNGYKRFKDETGFEAHFTEERVYSFAYGYAGTLDLAGYMNDLFCIIDIKTVTVLHSVIGLQTAAYLHAFNEMNRYNYGYRYALQLKKNAYKLQDYSDQNDFTYFTAALNLNNWRVNNGYS